MSIPRDNILLRKLPQHKVVKLPNGRTFYARYQRVRRDMLYSTRVRVKRTYKPKIGPRRQRKQRPPRRVLQSGSRYVNADNLMRGVNLVKRRANTDLRKMIIDDAIGFIPTAYNSIKRGTFGCKKIKPAVTSRDYYPDEDLVNELDYSASDYYAPPRKHHN